jgi:hypothetical protein
MLTRVLFAAALILRAATASAQLSPTTFGGIPLWADSALRAGGLDQRFKLSSALNPAYELGDFDRDGLLDVAVEIKDAGGLRCGVAITHRSDRSVHIVGAGEPLGNAMNELACGRWGAQSGRHRHRLVGFGGDLLYVTDARGHSGWVAWDGHWYVWIPFDGRGA